MCYPQFDQKMKNHQKILWDSYWVYHIKQLIYVDFVNLQVTLFGDDLQVYGWPTVKPIWATSLMAYVGYVIHVPHHSKFTSNILSQPDTWKLQEGCFIRGGWITLISILIHGLHNRVVLARLFPTEKSPLLLVTTASFGPKFTPCLVVSNPTSPWALEMTWLEDG